MAVFSETRNVERSLIKYLKTQIPNYFSDINIVMSFVEAYKQKLPVLAIEVGESIEQVSIEVGSPSTRKLYLASVDIFAPSEPLAMDLASRLVELINNGFVYYEYSTDSNSQEVLTANGRVQRVLWLSDARVSVSDSPSTYDKHRRVLSFTLRVAKES